jgi:hypothetical protein
MATGRRQLLVQYCIILNHISFFWEQKRRNPLILMLYASVKVIVLVWKIMENTEFILDILSALTRTPK